jgi:hypothetical protein
VADRGEGDGNRGEDKRKEVHGCGSASRAAEEVAAKAGGKTRRGGKRRRVAREGEWSRDTFW